MADPLLHAFVNTATTNLAKAGVLLSGMERSLGSASSTAINECYRAIHTISGVANYLACDRIAILAQSAERLLEEMRLNRMHRTSARIDALTRAVRRLTDLVAGLIDGSQPVVDDVDIIRELHAWITHEIPRNSHHRRVDTCAGPRFIKYGNPIPTGPPRRMESIKVGIL